MVWDDDVHSLLESWILITLCNIITFIIVVVALAEG